MVIIIHHHPLPLTYLVSDPGSQLERVRLHNLKQDASGRSMGGPQQVQSIDMSGRIPGWNAMVLCPRLHHVWARQLRPISAPIHCPLSQAKPPFQTRLTSLACDGAEAVHEGPEQSQSHAQALTHTPSLTWPGLVGGVCTRTRGLNS